jgi:hypothetical protein
MFSVVMSFHMFACSKYKKLMHKIRFYMQTYFLMGVILDLKPSYIWVNTVFMHHCCLLKKTLKSACHLGDTKRIYCTSE